jgi:hypothetical protein|tara:strand:+ start:13317 stop:13988 length:672 start_codon:yes stop_codon:yes gene_type:complete
MKTLILTGSDKSMWDVLDLTNPSKQNYAASKGYDFMCLRSFPGIESCGFKEQHIGFQRTAFAFKLLNHYDNVMWVDADSVITNFDYKLEDFIHKDACYIASYDWMHHTSFSSGNFIVRRTQNVSNFFNAFVQISQHFLEMIVADQGALNQMYNIPQYREDFCILDHKYLNAVPGFLTETQTWIKDNNRSGIVAPWTKDSFLAHFTGTENSERIQLIKDNKLNL